MLQEHLWQSSQPSEVADSTNKSYVGRELTANPIGMTCPDPLSRRYSSAHRFLSRRPLLRQSHRQPTRVCSLSALRYGPTLQPTGLGTSILITGHPGETQALDQRSLLSQIGRRSTGVRTGASKTVSSSTRTCYSLTICLVLWPTVRWKTQITHQPLQRFRFLLPSFLLSVA